MSIGTMYFLVIQCEEIDIYSASTEILKIKCIRSSHGISGV